MTKPEIVEAIVAAREANSDSDDSDGPDGSIDLPPSSPRGESEYSSDGETEEGHDDGNVAGGEETDVVGSWRRPRGGNSMLRRRATVNDVSNGSGRPLKSRSISMGQIVTSAESSKAKSGRGVADARSVYVVPFCPDQSSDQCSKQTSNFVQWFFPLIARREHVFAAVLPAFSPCYTNSGTEGVYRYRFININGANKAEGQSETSRIQR